MYKLKNRIHFALSVIRRRYSLLEVPWRRIHKAIAIAMSICVACGNKVMDTHLPLPVGSGDKYDVESRGQYGRSMIEMLGVLAIIAVLSVGGIAGYSKAMEKFKINRAVEEYTYLIQGLLEHLDDIKKMNADSVRQYSLVDLCYAKGLVPGNWQRLSNLGHADLEDSLGNNVRPFIRGNELVIDFYLGGRTKDEQGFHSNQFPVHLCEALMQNMVQPLHSSIISVVFSDSTRYYGDNFCSDNTKCLHDVTLQYIQKKCNTISAGFFLHF